MTRGTTNTYTVTKFPGPKLSEEDKIHCEKLLITLTEVANTIKTFEKKKKCPGIDSLPIDFYIFFWLDNKNLFMKLSFEVFEKGELTESQKLGVVSHLDKKTNEE